MIWINLGDIHVFFINQERIIVCMDIEIETYTHLLDEQSVEVTLVGVKPDKVGVANSFEPPEINRRHITTWFRKNYLINGNYIFSQLPTLFKDYPSEAQNQLDVEDAFLTSIGVNNKNIYGIYPVNDEESLFVEWNTEYDAWSVSKEIQPSEDGSVIPSKGYSEDIDIIWTR